MSPSRTPTARHAITADGFGLAGGAGRGGARWRPRPEATAGRALSRVQKAAGAGADAAGRGAFWCHDCFAACKHAGEGPEEAGETY